MVTGLMTKNMGMVVFTQREGTLVLQEHFHWDEMQFT